jgi:hypothetical protein
VNSHPALTLVISYSGCLNGPTSGLFHRRVRALPSRAIPRSKTGVAGDTARGPRRDVVGSSWPDFHVGTRGDMRAGKDSSPRGASCHPVACDHRRALRRARRRLIFRGRVALRDRLRGALAPISGCRVAADGVSGFGSRLERFAMRS